MYIELDEGYPGHRKTLRLCALLKCETADSYPPRLWAWAARSAPDGDLSGMEPVEIEMALRYRGKGGALFSALVGAGFIDHDESGKIAIHNWKERTGGAITRMEDRANRVRERRAHNQGRCLDQCSICAEHVPGSDPTQSPARPNPVQSSPVQSSPVQSSPVQSSDQIGDCGETAEPSSPPAAAVVPIDPPLLTFPCDGLPCEWHLTRSQVTEWRALFPSLDLGAECRAALAWVGAVPARRKTASGMKRFLVHWFTRSQNDGRRGPAGSPSKQAQALAAAQRFVDRGDAG